MENTLTDYERGALDMRRRVAKIIRRRTEQSSKRQAAAISQGSATATTHRFVAGELYAIMLHVYLEPLTARDVQPVAKMEAGLR